MCQCCVNDVVTRRAFLRLHTLLPAEVMESGDIVTFTGTAAVLTLGFGPGATTPFVARTVPPFTDVETVSFPARHCTS